MDHPIRMIRASNSAKMTGATGQLSKMPLNSAIGSTKAAPNIAAICSACDSPTLTRGE
jgi:hypothetical protein